jgi:hypothetical protein
VAPPPQPQPARAGEWLGRLDAASELNFAEWSGHLLHRLHRQVELTGDDDLARLYDEVTAYPNVSLEPPAVGGATQIVLPLRLRDGDDELSFFSTVTTFGTPVEVTLSELAVEAFYPADRMTSERLAR